MNLLNRCILVLLPIPLFAQALLSPWNAPCASATSTLLVGNSTQVCKTPQRLQITCCMLLWLLPPPIYQSSRAYTELRWQWCNVSCEISRVSRTVVRFHLIPPICFAVLLTQPKTVRIGILTSRPYFNSILDRELV